MGVSRDPVGPFVVEEGDDMHSLLPGERVDSQHLVDHQGAEGEGQRNEDGEDSTGHHEQVAPAG